MKNYLCPSCQNKLETITESDIEYEKCPNCQGLFLDKTELNLLAIGHSADIELHFINFDILDPGYKPKNCPKCKIDMQEVQVGHYSSVYLDFCPNCNGYFLDHLEEKNINDYLQTITKNKTPERYRGYIKNVLVRVDIESKGNSIYSNGGMIVQGYTPQNYLVISAFYKKPLDIDLFIVQESYAFKIIKMLLGIHKKDLQSGNKEFDNLFKIHAINELELKNHFTEYTITEILEFNRKAHKVFNICGKLSFNDDRIIYREGPYIDIPVYQDNENFNSIFYDLAEIVNDIK